jgi:hypothetical protein
MKVTDFLKGKFKYDNMGQYIWLVESDGNHQKIADIRGWGRIQHFFMDKKGKLDEKAAEAFQDEYGQWVVDALNKALKSESPVAQVIDHLPDVGNMIGRDVLVSYQKWFDHNSCKYSVEDTSEAIVDEYLSTHPLQEKPSDDIFKLNYIDIKIISRILSQNLQKGKIDMSLIDIADLISEMIDIQDSQIPVKKG